MLKNIFGNGRKKDKHQAAAGYMQDAAFSLLAHLGQAGIIADTNGIIRYMNEYAAKLTAWPEAEAAGKPLSTVLKLTENTNDRQLERHVTRALGNAVASPLNAHTVLIRADGTELAVEGSVAPIQDRGNRIAGVLVLLQDVSHQRKLTTSLTYEASHDALTGLVNRREFRTRLETAFAGSLRQNDEHALCFLDLDQFKVINDSCGHAAGDQLLCKVTELLKSMLHSEATLARLGGDEFGLLLQNVKLKEAVRVAESMLSAIKAFRFHWEGSAYTIGVSIGLTLMTRKSGDVNTIMSIADAACYAAKEKGRNRIQVFNPDDIELDQRQKEMRLVSRITTALDENRYVLYYQPIIPVCDGHDGTQHCEILLRMLNADGSLVQPAQFIPAAERYNLMPALDRWVIDRVFEVFHQRYPTRELKRAHQWSINISAASLSSNGFIEFIRDKTEKYDIVPQSICFEITETTAISDLQRVSDFLWGLRMDGFRFALDDFGKGMSSFSYLKILPVDYVKIDGEFIKNILSDKVSLAMTEAITRVVGVMGIKVVAEYVENNEILERLREIGVDYAQGYGISEPLLLEQMDKVSSLAEMRMRKQQCA